MQFLQCLASDFDGQNVLLKEQCSSNTGSAIFTLPEKVCFAMQKIALLCLFSAASWRSVIFYTGNVKRSSAKQKRCSAKMNGLRKHSSHYIQHVSETFNSFAEIRTICRHFFDKDVWTWQPSTVESTYPRCRPINARKTSLCCPPHEICSVIASFVHDKFDARCRSL